MKTLSQDILLIEDDSHDVELTLQEFEAHDFQQRIVVLRDGREAIKFLFERPESAASNLPRAILIGWKLSKLGGLEVLRRLKSEVRTRRIPTFLLLSSQYHVEHLAKEQMQPDGYLIKPVAFQDFARLFGPAEVRQSQGNQLKFGTKQI